MPARNVVKQYILGGHYHVYNRGVDKRIIFLDDTDYRVFLKLLKVLLSPPDINNISPLSDLTGWNPVRQRQMLKTLHGEVDLLAYCLMPNHFHLLVKQSTIDGTSKLVKRLATSYSMYFNRKYKRKGSLFQGTFKGVLINEDPYLLHLTRYIHLNPYEICDSVGEYPYSSYAYYLGKKTAEWIKPGSILAYFKPSQRIIGLRDFLSYQSFVEDFKEDPKEMIGNLAIED